ncbi:MAG: hypothetical protein CMJ46_02730 [Planctomyces sp.]|nr:hypothetical protein [Planctomyces sp.]
MNEQQETGKVNSITCPKCGAPIREKDVNQAAGVARCTYCEAWLSISDLVNNEETLAPSKAMYEDSAPEGIEVRESEQGLFVLIPLPPDKVPRPAHETPLILLISAWVLLCPVIALSLDIDPITGLVFGIVTGLTAMLALLISTKLNARDQYREISILERRKLLLTTSVDDQNSVSIPVDGMKQFYVTQAFEKYAGVNRGDTLLKMVYTLNGLSEDNSPVPILEGLESKAEAIFIERTIEKHLDIADKPVAGEVN